MLPTTLTHNDIVYYNINTAFCQGVLYKFFEISGKKLIFYRNVHEKFALSNADFLLLLLSAINDRGDQRDGKSYDNHAEWYALVPHEQGFKEEFEYDINDRDCDGQSDLQPERKLSSRYRAHPQGERNEYHHGADCDRAEIVQYVHNKRIIKLLLD